MIQTENMILISISVLQRRWKNIIDQSTFTRSIFIQLEQKFVWYMYFVEKQGRKLKITNNN